MTRSLCQLTCGYQGYAYAGLEAGKECYCGNSSPTTTGSGCSTTCTGDSSSTCGGSWRLDTFKRGAQQSTTSTTSSTSSSTTTTTTTTTTKASTTSSSSSTSSSTSTTTSSSAASTASSSSSWTSLGCYSDQSSPQRSLTGASYTDTTAMTYGTCQTYCLNKGFVYAGVEYGSQCYCGNAINSPGTTVSGCAMACAGDSTKVCGGSWLITMFKYTGSSSSSSTSTTSTATSSTASATSSSLPAAAWSSLGCYTDQSSPIRSLSGTSYTDSALTYAKCQTYCLGKGFSYAGVEYGTQCWCGNTVNSPGALTTSSKCTMACSGDTANICGGSYLMNLFYYNPAGVSSSSSSIASSSTASSTSLVSTASSTSSVSTASSTSSVSTVSGSSTTLSGSSTITSTTSSSSATSSSLPAGWSSLGCYTDQDARTLSGASITDTTATTYATCQAYCLAKGFYYAGVEYGQECYCGSKINSPGTTTLSSNCNKACAGDATKMCGGTWTLNVFVYTPGSSSSSVSGTGTSSLSSTGTGTVSTSASASTTSSVSGTSTSCTSTASASSCPTSTPTVTGYANVGCYLDSYNRVLPVSAGPADTTSRTTSSCFAQCFALGYAYAGLETGSECWCGDSIHMSSDSGSQLSTASCAIACTGDSKSTCGGSWALMIYYNQALDPGSCSYTSSSSSSTTVSGTISGTATATSSSASVTITGTPTATGNGWVSYDKSKDGKLVFAHFMVGNTWSYDSTMWSTQIALAQAQGIDAFALNFGSPSWELDRMADGYNAAAAAGFKVFLSFDMTSVTCTGNGDISTITSTILRWANHAAQLKDSNGAVYVGTFAGEYCSFGSAGFTQGWVQAVKSGPKSSGVTTKFIPSFFSDSSLNSQFTSFMDGTFPWNNAWPMGNYDETWSPDTAQRNSLSGSQVYMAGVSPWFFTHYGADTYNKNWIYRGDDWLYNKRWEDIIAHRSSVDLVEIITWNDYGESHYIGPIGKDQPMSNAWVDGFDHTAWLTMTGYYIQLYKTGVAPTIIQDKIYMWARPHGTSDTCGDYIGRPNNADWTSDYLWIVLFSTGSGTLQVQQGASTGSFPVTAGINKLQLASGVTSSGVTAVLTRNSAQVFSYFAPITFTHSPTTYNFNAFVFSGP